jgi:tetratricopeptide (TPR) repeat protein
MLKNITKITLVCLFISSASIAQQTEWFTLNQHYKSGLELFDKGKFVAANEQFSKVEQLNTVPSTQPADNRQVSLLKENAKFYQAVCALKLSNQNAESLFLKFIREYPASANTKSAYFHMGSSYFERKNYEKAIEWFKQIDANSLTANETAE